MNAFAAHFAFEFRTGIRNKNLLLLNYLFPLGFYLMMGAIMPAVNPPFREGLIPAMVTFAVLASTLLGLPDPLVSARENGIFRSYKVNGVPAAAILAIPSLTTMLHVTIVAALITFTAPVLFDAPAPAGWLSYTAVFLALAFACTAIGILIGVVSPSTRMTVLYSQVVFLPSMILGGLMLPYSLLPVAAQKAAQLFPATHAMNAFNGLAMGSTADFSPWGSIATLALSGVLAFGLAHFLFRWDSHHAAKHRHPLLALLVLVPYLAGWMLL